jgi:hypothetical protein
MVEKSTMMLGEEPSPRDIEDIERLKVDIVEQLRAAGVQFPIKNKLELEKIYPKGTRKACMFRGKEESIHDLIKHIDDRVFPIKNAGDAAIALVSSCQLNK